MTDLCSQCTWKQQNQQLEQQLTELRQEQNRFLFERAVIAMMGNREDERPRAQQYLIRSGVGKPEQYVLWYALRIHSGGIPRLSGISDG